jgi:NAD(P)-dependent dehydrogenase (short-subunit alcohol dehydrogenase family)
MDSTRYKSKVVFVSGAGSGIGNAAARRIAAEGGTVACGLLDESQRPAIGNLDGHVIDVARAESWDEVLGRIVARHGGLDVLVNCAAILRSGAVEETAPATWDEVMAVNLTGSFLGCQKVWPHLKQRGGGAIVNLSSLNGIRGIARAVAYATSKGGIVAMTMALALEGARDKIRVNCICPGTIDTPMVQAAYRRAADPAAAAQAAIDRHPIGRVGAPDEVAALIAYLASDEAQFMTGQAIALDGGRSIDGGKSTR